MIGSICKFIVADCKSKLATELEMLLESDHTSYMLISRDAR